MTCEIYVMRNFFFHVQNVIIYIYMIMRLITVFMFSFNVTFYFKYITKKVWLKFFTLSSYESFLLKTLCGNTFKNGTCCSAYGWKRKFDKPYIMHCCRLMALGLWFFVLYTQTFWKNKIENIQRQRQRETEKEVCNKFLKSFATLRKWEEDMNEKRPNLWFCSWNLIIFYH